MYRNATETAATFKIATSNGSFFQIHLVGAQTEDEARALAEEAANAPETLAEEARMSSQIGADPAGRYRAFRVTETGDNLDDGEVRFLDSGAEG
ncbi:MAG: hypothetical protein VW547_02045 [Alphaproteobacteria bacterium]